MIEETRKSLASLKKTLNFDTNNKQLYFCKHITSVQLKNKILRCAQNDKRFC